jgi:transaldolase
MSQNTRLLSEAGVSIWLDDINRESLTNGKLQGLIDDSNVVGVTTNPTIFATALAKGSAYDEQLAELTARGVDVPEAVFEITTRDVRDAADLFRDVYERTDGKDGYVSIEVSPENAYNTEATIAEALKLWDTVERPNVMIKVPATMEGLPAITELIGRGINVNVTLIFSLTRYRQVIQAYLEGLRQARAKELDITRIHSVASFFVSRVDTEINKRLDQLDKAAALELRNKIAVANARLAYRVFLDEFATAPATELLELGANRQRPLWASTGVKTDELPDTYYVDELIAPDTVNTMPEKTLVAVADHGIVKPLTAAHYYEADEPLMQLAELDVDLDAVTDLLEREGVEKFLASWAELGATVEKQLGSDNLAAV